MAARRHPTPCMKTLTAALPSSPYCLVTRRATRIPGEHQVTPATYSCPVALCAGPLSHADGGAVGRNTAWHASALADLALR